MTSRGHTMRNADSLIDRDWMVTAALGLARASADLLQHVRHYYAELLGLGLNFISDEDGLDTEYFRQRMAEARQREKRRRMHRIAELLASRSADLVIDEAVSLDTVPGLAEALDGLVGSAFPVEMLRRFAGRSDFDLDRYQRHIMAHMGMLRTDFDTIPALIDEPRKDRIFRFIAAIFLAHAGQIELWQDGERICLRKNEAYEQRQGIPRSTEEAA